MSFEGFEFPLGDEVTRDCYPVYCIIGAYVYFLFFLQQDNTKFIVYAGVP